MARDGSGTYTAPVNSVNPAVAATTIVSADFNALVSDLETALTTSLASDGTTTASASIPFANGIQADVIAEITASGNGVTIDSVLLKDGRVDSAQGGDIASATTTDIGAATGNYVVVTGTTTITGLGTKTAGNWRLVKFAGVLTFTHNATTLILPTGANITTAAGDLALMVSEGSGNWRCALYTRADGTPLAGTTTAGTGTAITGTAISVDPNNATDTAIAVGDEILFADADDSNNPKKDTVQGILDLVSSLAAASQAQMETGTSTAVATTPGRQHNHPGHPKAWVVFDTDGTIDSSWGVTGVTNPSLGDFVVTFSTAFSTDAFCCQLTTHASGDNNNGHLLLRGKSTTTATITRVNAAGSPNEDVTTAIHAVFWGDQ